MTVDSARTGRQIPSMGANNGVTTALLHYTTVLHKRVSSSGDGHIAEDAGVWGSSGALSGPGQLDVRQVSIHLLYIILYPTTVIYSFNLHIYTRVCILDIA